MQLHMGFRVPAAHSHPKIHNTDPRQRQAGYKPMYDAKCIDNIVFRQKKHVFALFKRLLYLQDIR